MSTEVTLKCPICGEPYKAYAFYAGDQSACSSCRSKANNNKKVQINVVGSVPPAWQPYIKDK